MNLIGQRIGDYELLLLLGHGSSADVYLGRHRYNRSYVAVKTLNPQVLHKRINVWNNEGYMLSHLSHPHIVHMSESGIQDDISFRIINWAARGTFHDLFEVSTPIQKVATYIQQVASALHYLHVRNIIHRDIKPTNILVEPYGYVWLADLELAVDYRYCKSTDGTALYAPLEQKRGHPCPASDQYALAIVTYQWLCGEHPFHGSSDDIIAQQEHNSPRSLRDISSSLPRAVEQVVLMALAQDPGSRFTSVQAFAEALQDSCRFSSYWTPAQRAELPYTEIK